MYALEGLRTAVGLTRGSGEVPPKGELRRSIPFTLAMALVSGISMGVGGAFLDATGMGHVTAVAVGLAVLFVFGLPVSHPFPSHPFVRRIAWTVALTFVLTMGVGDGTFASFPLRLAAGVAVAVVISLLANRLIQGSWFPFWRRD